MTRLARLALASCAAFAALASLPRTAIGAPLDDVPDAVVGKPDFATGTGGAASATNILWAAAIAEDPASGELWVADFNGSRVLRYASAKDFANGTAANLVLGQPDFVSSNANRGGAVAADSLNRPAGVAVDAARRLYVADTENHRILIFHPPFTNGMAAKHVIGQDGFTSGQPNRGGAAGANTLNRPHGLAVDRAGRLWAADLANARVVGYDAHNHRENAPPARRVVGQPNLASTAPSLTASGMSQPAGVTFDPDDRLWVADQAFHRVMRYGASSDLVSGEAAREIICQPDFTSASTGVGVRGCYLPTTVAFPGGTIAVGDFGNSRVLYFAGARADAFAVLGQPDFDARDCNRGAAAPGAGTFCGPRALLTSRHGDLLVADAGNGRVIRFDAPISRPRPSAGAITRELVASASGATISVEGAHLYADSVVHVGGEPRATRFISHTRLAVTLAPGDLAAVGEKTLTVVTPSPGGGVSAPFAVYPYARTAADAMPDRHLGVASLAARFNGEAWPGQETIGEANALMMGNPRGVAIDRVTGRLFVLDREWARVLSWPRYDAFQNAEPADLVIGAPDFFTTGCSTTSRRTFCAPAGIAVDDGGRVYVADTANHRVLRFDPPYSTGMAAAAVLGQGGSFDHADPNRGGLGAASLFAPGSVATHGTRLFVGDSGNCRVLVFDDALAGGAAGTVLGRATMTEPGNGATVDAAKLGCDLKGLSVDAQGRVLVADGSRHRVLRFSPPFANGMAADLVIGQQDFASSGFGNTERTLWQPRGVTIDAEGSLLVADSSNHRVLRFASPLSTGMAASAVLGQAALDTGEAHTRLDRVTTPSAVAVDAAGNVLVASSGDQRVLAYDRPFGVETSKRLVNIATRMAVLTGNDVLIGGFIVGGTVPKKVVVRARGPSLAQFGIAGVLANPLLQVFSGATPIATNDNWQQATNAAEIQASGFAPAHALESAVLMTLQPGAYTAIVSGAGGVTGVGIVEVFEVDGAASPLVNIATRGRVLTGDNVMIGGFVIQGDSPQTVIVRARGPSLAAAGVPGALANPLLQLFAGAAVIAANDDWTVAPNAVAIQASGFVPPDPRESAILVTLQPGAYTAVVSGVGGATGVAIVEVFVP